jgi:hypothetical protein
MVRTALEDYFVAAGAGEAAAGDPAAGEPAALGGGGVAKMPANCGSFTTMFAF